MKLNRLSRVRPAAAPEADSVCRSRLRCGNDDRRRGAEILLEAQNHYMNMERFRRDRERNKRYNYGDQWGDIICVDGKRMTEERYIMEQGNIPLKNNMIRRLTRNVIGVYRSQSTEPTCIARDRDEQQLAETMSTVLQYNMGLNRLGELYARTMEEFLISGFVVHRKWYGIRNDKEDCWTDAVQPNNFFIDCNMRDFRGWDCSCVGEIHDVPFQTLCKEFAHTPQDYKRLSEIYAAAKDRPHLVQAWAEFGYTQDYGTDFLSPQDSTLCRVIEVWRKESRPRYWCHDYNDGSVFKVDAADYKELVEDVNAERLRHGTALGVAPDDIPLIQARWYMDEYWYYYHLSPMGDILAEGETPYRHKSHPYVFKAYPYIDGEIHSFVSDVIDQQRYTNRLITLYDWIIRASAKGVLLIPEDSLPKGTSVEDFADTWAKFNGVVVYKPSQYGQVPRQVAANSTNIGVNELLSLQLKFFEDISGVNGALQGKPGYSGMSAALYNQQTQNATTSLLDLLEVFNSFIVDAAYKDVKNIQQYYDDKRISSIAGKNGAPVGAIKRMHDVEFDLNIVPSTATPAYRALANEFLMEVWRSGQITLQQLLENGEFPFADRLLQSIKSQEEAMQSGQQPQGLPADVASQVQQNADPRAVDALQRALR